MSEHNAEQPLLSITSIGGEVTLELTATQVRMRLSDELLAKVRGEIEAEPERQSPGLVGAFVRAVTGFVSHMVGTTISSPLADIDSVTNDHGVLTFTYNKKHTPSFGDVHTDGKAPRYSEADAAAFVAKFNELKRG